MICERRFRMKKNGKPYSGCFCQHPELIENYNLAIADETQVWDCHHRREELYSQKELIERGEYYDVSPEELIFLTKAEHYKMDSACKRISETLKGMKLSDETKRKMSEAHSKKKVLCVETGEIFESTRDACRKTGIDNISKACLGKYKTAGGYHWTFI